MKSDSTRAVSSLVGTIIGAGIFGVPFVFAQAGFLVGTVIFLALTGALLILHLMYGEVVERTPEQHRLIGYSGIYFGSAAKDFMSFSVVIGAYGALVAYILLADQFLNTLLPNPDGIPFFWGAIFWGVISVGIVKGLKTISRVEVLLSALLVAIFGVIGVSSIPHIQFEHFATADLSKAFLPYGVLMFALVGFTAVPEMKNILIHDGRRLRNTIIAGSLVAAAITFLFGAVVFGVTGPATTDEAIGGLLPYVGRWIVYIGAAFGIVAVSTSYLINGVNLKESFMYDWNMRPFLSNLLLIAIPVLVVFIGVRSFIGVLGFTGAFLGAINGIMVAALYKKARQRKLREPGYQVRIPQAVLWGIVGILALGAVYVIINIGG